MVLIPCYECEKEISDKAPACPHCGAPKEEQPPQIEEKDERFNQGVAFAVGAFVFMIARALGVSEFDGAVSFVRTPAAWYGWVVGAGIRSSGGHRHHTGAYR
jgi:predicted amidophosphoribosyltransferase